MAIIHVAATTRNSGVLDNGRDAGCFSVMGTWIDDTQETVPWEHTGGKMVYHDGFRFHWSGATYTRELMYRELFPWLANMM
jgi:hypothetical protein